MNKDGFSEVDFGLNLSLKSLKNKKLILIRHPKDLDIATIFNEKQIKIPQKGVLSEPIVTDGDGTHCLNYKLMVDKDPVHNTFRPIIQGGALGPAFDGSMSIVRCVNTGSKEGEGPTTPAITAYSKVPQVQGLKPSLLARGSLIDQQVLDARVASIGESGTAGTGVEVMTPAKSKDKDKDKDKDKERKKKRKTAGEGEGEGEEVAEEATPATASVSKQKKEKKPKK